MKHIKVTINHKLRAYDIHKKSQIQPLENMDTALSANISDLDE